MRLSLILSLLVIFTLSACASAPKPQPLPTRTITKTKIIQEYPEFPDIKPLPSLNLSSFSWEYPRDPGKKIPRSTEKCLSVADAERDDAFWERCGEHPPQIDSNIFMGLGDKDFKTFQLNWVKIRAQLKRYRSRIEEVNRQRQEWRRKAEVERNKRTKLQEAQSEGK
ncbi:MAG: hypothetical protein Q9M28_03530 [Mariprofundaceae bacterium]|nr:hypothetical protein [Mariprofundaceae bacterium]